LGVSGRVSSPVSQNQNQPSYQPTNNNKQIIMTSTQQPIQFVIEDSVALVTGTNKPNGIGSHIVRALLENGARKVYATARNITNLDYLVQEFPNHQVVPVELDVTNAEALQDLPNRYPDVTIVVNNAGYFSPNRTAEEVTTELQVNYLSPFLLVKAFTPIFQIAASKGKSTAVVNVNSIASYVNFPAGPTYSASKAAAHSLTQAQRRELAQHGTLVVGVYPGPIDTDMAKGLNMPKATPRSVGLEVITALTEGREDVFPDDTARNTYQAWKDDAKAVEISLQKLDPFETVPAEDEAEVAAAQ